MYSEEVIQTYEKILRKEQKAFSPYFFQPEHRKDRVITLVKYLVEVKLNASPQDAVKIINVPILKKYELLCILTYIDKPKEAADDDVDYIIYYAYPEMPKPTFEERTITVYTDFLEGKRSKYPKNYFVDGEIGEKRAVVCFRYLCEKILGYVDEQGNILKDKIVETFLSREYLQILKTYKLKIVMDVAFLSMVDLLESAYPKQLDYTKRKSVPLQVVD